MNLLILHAQIGVPSRCPTYVTHSKSNVVRKYDFRLAANSCGEPVPSSSLLLSFISNGDTVADEEEKSSTLCCFVHVSNLGYASLNSLSVSYSCLITSGSTSNPTTLTKSVSKSLWKRIVNRT